MIPLIIVLSLMLPGALSAAFLLGTAKIPARSGLILALAFPLGAGLVSLILFFSFMIAQANGPLLSLILTGLLTAALTLFFWPPAPSQMLTHFAKQTQDLPRKILGFIFRPFTPGGGTPGEKKARLLELALFALLLAVFCHYLFYFWGQITWNPLGGWDARYFWKLKARFYFRDPAEWMGMFSPLPGAWSHPDYPLMLPGAFAWSWFVTGRETFVGPAIVSLGFSLSLAGLVFWYLSTHTSRAAACAAAAFLMNISMWRFWSTTLYADLPLTFFITASGLFAVLGLRNRNARFFLAAGIFAGLGLWTKDEGLFFLVWLGLILMLASLKSGRPAEILRGRLIPCLLGAVLPLAAVILIKGFLGTTGGQYLGSGRSIADFAALLFGNFEKTKLIAAVFGIFAVNHAQWNGLWILTAVCAALCGRRGFGDYRWVFLALALMIWAGYFVILHVTPYDLKFQIETALLRIMSHAMGLALIFSAESVFFKKTPAETSL